MAKSELDAFKKPTNGRKLWELPPIETVVDLLRIKGGSINALLDAVADEPEDQEQILFLILEELSRIENVELEKRWRRYVTLNYKNKMLRGTDQILTLYGHGTLDKHQFVKDLGKSILPEIFNPSVGGMGKQEEDEKALEQELNDFS
jgi:hypothetical protein